MEKKICYLSFFILTACGSWEPGLLLKGGFSGPEILQQPFDQLDEFSIMSPREKNFFQLQNEVLIPYCVSCHSSTVTKGGIDLSNFARVSADKKLIKWGFPDESLVYTTVLEGSMPPREMLSDELTDRIYTLISEVD